MIFIATGEARGKIRYMQKIFGDYFFVEADKNRDKMYLVMENFLPRP